MKRAYSEESIMTYLKTTINDADVVIEDVRLSDCESRGIRSAEDIFAKMTPVLAGIVNSGTEAIVRLDQKPSAVTMTFSMGYSGEAQAWVIKGSGELAFEVGLTWEEKK